MSDVTPAPDASFPVDERRALLADLAASVNGIGGQTAHSRGGVFAAGYERCREGVVRMLRARADAITPA